MMEHLLGNAHCKSMGIAEVAISPIQKIASTDGMQKFEWKSIVKPGLACFVQDADRNNIYFIQAFDLDKGQRVFDQRVDLKMQYRRRRRHLLTFDGDYGLVCLNFVDDDEADHFSFTMSGIVENKANKTLGEIPNRPGVKDGDSSQNPTPLIHSDLKLNDDDKKKTKKEKKGLWGRLFGSDDKEDPDAFSLKKIQNQIGEEEFEKLKIFLKVARLDVSILDDPKKGPEIYQFYKDQVLKSKVQIEVERQGDYGEIDDILDEDAYSEPELSDNEVDILNEDTYDDEDFPEPPKVTAPKPDASKKGVVSKTTWPPQKVEEKVSMPEAPQINQTKPTSGPVTKFEEKNNKTTRQGGTSGAPPPPPPPAPAPPPPKLSISATTKTGGSVKPNSNSSAAGSGRGDLMSDIRSGGTGLRKTTPKAEKDVKSRTTNTLSDILGGALAKIKEVNIVYGDEPNLDPDSNDSDW